MSKLSPDEIQTKLKELVHWNLEGVSINRQFVFKSFADAIAFIVQIGFSAEAADHHPDIVVNYKRVTLSYSTHSEGGITQRDFDGAKMADSYAV